MSIQHVSWGSIELLQNLVRSFRHNSEVGEPSPVVEYRSKVKLHGSNCAIQLTATECIAQSRTAVLSPEADYKGFAAWVHTQRSYFSSLRRGMVLFGEWCGPGVEKGMAVSQAAQKIFAIFAVRTNDVLVCEPDEIRAIVPANGAPASLFVLPWESDTVCIDFGSRVSLENAAAVLSARVADVEHEDPWVKKVFGVSGLGEGLVFYPVTVNGHAPDRHPTRFTELMFKAKGETHRTVAARTAVQVDPTVVASAEDFVRLVLTHARLEQGVTATGGTRDPRMTGRFLAWVLSDVQKESRAELEASGLTWERVERFVQDYARTWFLRAP